MDATFAIWATSMPWAESSTICALRQVTTDPDERGTIRSNLLPSSLIAHAPASLAPSDLLASSLLDKTSLSARLPLSGGPKERRTLADAGLLLDAILRCL